MRELWELLSQCCYISQVAERSLFLWNNEYIVSLVAQQRTAVLPLVFAALERNERNHWNPQVHVLPFLHLPCTCDTTLNAWGKGQSEQASAYG